MSIEEIKDTVEEGLDFVKDNKDEIKLLYKSILTFKRMCAEKGTMQSIGMILIAYSLRLLEMGRYNYGLGCLGLGVLVLFLREYHKGNRWHLLHVLPKGITKTYDSVKSFICR